MGASIYSGSNEHTPPEAFASMVLAAQTIQAEHAFLAAHAAEEAARSYRLESTAFTHSLIALAAKLAAVDGAVNPAEYSAFQVQFVNGGEMPVAQARSLFLARALDGSAALQYARQLASVLEQDEATRRDVLSRLLAVALADGPLNAAEVELLRAVADVFGIERGSFRGLLAQGFSAEAPRTPYEVIGVSPKATDKELRDRYMARVQKLHPDRYQAAGASEETLAMLSDQLAALNAAYDAVQKERARNASKGAFAWFRNTKGAKLV